MAARTIALVCTALALLGAAGLTTAQPALADQGSASGGDAGAALELTSEPPSGVLTPGRAELWPIGVTTRAQTLSSLTAQLSATGALAALSVGPSAAVTIAMDSCAQPWTDGRCAPGSYRVLAPTPLGALSVPSGGAGAAISDPSSTIPARVYLLARVVMSTDAGNAVQGAKGDVRVTVSASGELGSSSGQTLPPTIADTGSRITGFALLGVLAVGVGLTLAWIARRRRADG